VEPTDKSLAKISLQRGKLKLALNLRSKKNGNKVSCKAFAILVSKVHVNNISWSTKKPLSF
jgi:hypothetical protein